jgi:endoplasmic reticulum resident protein 44
MRNYKSLFEWAHDKCVPVVREITFMNGEELTEEGLPFLILFHKKEDTKSLKEYTDTVARTLMGQRNSINFLHADCDQFSHPLHHLGKKPADCPMIVIDSFKHMYLFPDYQEAHMDQKLLEFVKDQNSGKLHREFHNGPGIDFREKS